MLHSMTLTRAIFLISGTTIGGGMLALPVLTGLSGFVPSLVLYFLCWAFMASTGLLFLEVCSWMKNESNIVTMADKTLGFYGKAAAWGLYLFLFYCLIVAYIVGCSNLFAEIFGGQLSNAATVGLFLLASVPFVYLGSQVVAKFNLLLMIGLAGSYLMFVILGAPFVRMELLNHADWSATYLALPIAFIAFAYQGIVPTIYHSLECDVKKTRTAIIVGSFLPLVAYAIWQWLILGIVPLEGADGLRAALTQEQNAVAPLKNQLQQPYVYIIGQFFAFFALITSFFGVALGLVDFLADGLSIKKNAVGRLKLCLIIFIPPTLIALSNPHIFLTALDVAGGFGSALLLGLLPVIMVWRGRYYLGMKGERLLPGGRGALAMLSLFIVIELCCEFVKRYLQ